jgi:acetyl esterase/lipase
MRTVEERGIHYATVDGHELLLDIHRPAERAGEPAPCVIYVHGGGWNSGSREDSPNYLLAESGFVTISIDYRLTDIAAFPAQIHDVKSAIRWVRANAGELGIHPDRIGIWGHSAGGHLALLAAVTADDPALEGEVGITGVSSAVRAVIAGCTRTEMMIDWYAAEGRAFPEPVDESLSALFGGPRHEQEDVAQWASPFWHLRLGLPPTLMMHGTEDETVPISQARAFVSRSRAMGNEIQMMELPGVAHDANTPLFRGNPDPHGSRQRVVEFFRLHLQ